MILEKRLNGLWWFYDAFYMDSFTPYPFGCIIDRSAKTKNGSQFFIESDSLFTENKTFVNTIGGGDSIDSILFLNESMTNSLIKLNIFGSGLNSNNHIEIRVYN